MYMFLNKMSFFVIIVASFDQPVYLDLIKFRKEQLKKYNIPHAFVYDTDPPSGFVCDGNDHIFKRPSVPEQIDVIHPEYNPHMILKFLKTLHVIPIHMYDYFIRVNLSTFINFSLLRANLLVAPRANYTAGYNICVSLPDWCVSSRPSDVINFISGACMIFSRDIIEYFKSLSFGNPLFYTHNDDVILSHLIKQKGIDIHHMDMYPVENDMPILDMNCIIYRIKHHYDRYKDIGVWKQLLKKIDGLDV